MADILLDLRYGYTITNIEYKVERIDDQPTFYVQAFAVPLENEGDETNITDDVMDAFYNLVL